MQTFKSMESNKEIRGPYSVEEQLECLREFDEMCVCHASNWLSARRKCTTIEPISVSKYVEMKREQIADGPFCRLKKQTML